MALRNHAYYFFADKTDKLKILEFIFCEMGLKVYDLGSPYSKEVSEYKNAKEIEAKFDLETEDKFAQTFQLWSPRHKGLPIFRRIELNPKYCNGHTFRYSTDGWGLIQLYFGGIKNQKLSYSYIGHFREKEALKHESSNSTNGQVADWDWNEILKTSKQLKQELRRLAQKQIGIFDVLEGAFLLEESGIVLR